MTTFWLSRKKLCDVPVPKIDNNQIIETVDK